MWRVYLILGQSHVYFHFNSEEEAKSFVETLFFHRADPCRFEIEIEQREPVKIKEEKDNG